MTSSLKDRVPRLRARRFRTAALPSARMSWASGVEQPKASTMGKELLRCLCVLGLGLSPLRDGDECRFSIFGDSGCGGLLIPSHGLVEKRLVSVTRPGSIAESDWPPESVWYCRRRCQQGKKRVWKRERESGAGGMRGC